MNNAISATARWDMALAILENPHSYLALRRLAWWSLLSLRTRMRETPRPNGSTSDDAA